MKKRIAILVFLLMPSLAFAGQKSFYYPSAIQSDIERGALKNEALKKTLFKVLTEYHHIENGKPDTLGCNTDGRGKCYRHKSLGYRGARKVLFGKIHLDEDSRGYFVKDVYCNREFDRSQTNVGPNIIPNSNLLNCEHTWPKSKFNTRFSNDMQKSDLHHLYPTDSKANSTRGNYNFADVNGEYVESYCKSSRIGSAKSSSRRFEPPQEHKGNVARSLFYFSVRYQIEIPDSEESYLREWNRLDPVDAEEMERNETIHSIQGNRNPFIDYPNLANNIQNF